MLRLESLLAPRFEHRILALMLVLLHFSLWGEFGGALSRSLMLAHLGLFLIWQPLWSRELRLRWHGSLIFVLGAVIFVVWFSWWLMTFWLLMLIGLVGGRVTTRRAERYAYLMTLVFLVSELLIGCIPPMFNVPSLGAEVTILFGYGLLAVPVGLVCVPAAAASDKPAHAVDFLYGLTMSLLTSILALGSLLAMYATGADYSVAMFETVLGIALFLLAISWLWAPLAGFSGFGQLWERYLQNIGTPFEHWLGNLARRASEHDVPENFLRAAADELLDLPWVAGVTWRAGATGNQHGEVTGHAFEHSRGDFLVVIYAHRPPGTALLLHAKLLLQLVEHFYRAKQRERELAQRAHLQAIYETGARVTHDIKNLLQSLHAMSVAVQQSGKQEPERRGVQRLLKRQLPNLTQRLQLALEKLQAPASAVVSECPLSEWWSQLKARNETHDISFHSELEADPMVPMDLLDSVAENLLENARFKRQSEPGIDIGVRLRSRDGDLRLSVTDSGSPVMPEIAGDLFKAPVKSRSGLGIGLYQAARQAEQYGYSLCTADPDRQGVCFELRGTVNPPAEINGLR